MKYPTCTRLRASLVVAIVATIGSAPAFSQVSISAGPHVSTLGIGVSGEVRLMRLVGVSAEYNIAPISSTEKVGFNTRLSLEPTIGGGMIMLMLHPMGGGFALGAGLMQGGINADATMSLDPNANAEIAIGNGSYPASQVGTLVGTFEFGNMKPAFLLGWVGRGFNFALGAAIATPTLDLNATGALKNDPAFMADLDRETADIEDDLKMVPVYPYIRLGWQLGF